MSPESRNSPFHNEQRRLHSRKSILVLRAAVIREIRNFFISNDYLEVETPLLVSAPAPEVHIDAISTSAGYLHTSPELCMKRMLAAGFTKIFQISKCFRAGERGHRHLPEFCLLEWYRTGIDYHDLMTECRELTLWVCRKILGQQEIHYQGEKIDIQSPWKRIPVADVFDRFASITMEDALSTDRFDEIMAIEIEPRLGSMGPVFLYDYPASLASLARLKANQPEYSERFEWYMGGMELGNGFSELTDSREQRARFEQASKQRNALGKEGYPMPERFLDALGQMPESGGMAVGIDRLVMILSDRSVIDDVVAFTPEEV